MARKPKRERGRGDGRGRRQALPEALRKAERVPRRDALARMPRPHLHQLGERPFGRARRHPVDDQSEVIVAVVQLML